MSTRSGKRIHSSFHENICKADVELGCRSEKKTRSKRLKENLEDINVKLLKSKKRENYVSFPTDDESVGDTAVINDSKLKATRSLRRNVLIEQNYNVLDIETLDSTTEPRKVIRTTRRTKKFSENGAEDIPDTKNIEVSSIGVVEKPQTKRNKKKKEPIKQTNDETVAGQVLTRKSRRKKKKSSSNSLIVEDIPIRAVMDNSINEANISTESFHSAAGSPQRMYENKEEPSNNSDLESNQVTTSKYTTFGQSENAPSSTNISKNVSLSFYKIGKSEKPKKNKSSNNSCFETDKKTIDIDYTEKNKIRIQSSDVKISTFEKNDAGNISGDNRSTVSVKNTTFEKDFDLVNDTFPIRKLSKKRSSVKGNNLSLTDTKDVNATFERDSELAIDNKNSVNDSNLTLTQTNKISIIYDNDQNMGSSNTRKRKSSMKDTTISFETKGNTTFEKDTEVVSRSMRKRKSSIKDTKLSFTPISTKDINKTFEKDNEVESFGTRKRKSSIKDINFTFTPIITKDINTTFDKDTEADTWNNRSRKSAIKDANSTFTPIVTKDINTTFENDTEVVSRSMRKRKSSIKDTKLSFTPISTKDINKAFEKDNEVELCGTRNRKSSIKDINFTFTPIITKDINTTFDKDTEADTWNNRSRKSSIKDANSTFTPIVAKDINTTFEKDTEVESPNTKSTIRDSALSFTFAPKETNITFDKVKELQEDDKIAPIKDTTFDKNDISVLFAKTPFEKRNSNINKNTNGVNNKRKSVVNSENLNNTYDKSPSVNETSENPDQNNTFNKSKELKDTTFDKDKKLDSTYDKSNPKLSLVTSDSSNNGTIGIDMSHVSITSDESTENIINTTPLLIESSMEDSQMFDDMKKVESPAKKPQTLLKREGTFTKESVDVAENLPVNKTPTKRMSLPSPGCTPFVARSSNREKVILNVTRSIEKEGRSSLVDVAPRQTKVMFCSPMNNPGVVTQQKRKVIKSNLKGSNKSFVLNDSACRPAPRKRSYTQSDADDARVKRKRLAGDIQTSVDRLSRPRTTSASAKLEPSTPSKKHTTPSKTKPDAKVSRTKLPNFAALHQRRFEKMESLDECQERKAKRAKQLLTPTGTLTTLDRSAAKGPSPEQQSQKDLKSLGTPTKRFQTQLPTLDSIKPGFTRFGFKLNLDSNPFSIPKKNVEIKPKEIKPNALKREPTLPSLVGATSLRREAAKQIVLREKSFSEKRNVKRNENRTVIKGVRTNRRFELQMRMRNIE